MNISFTPSEVSILVNALVEEVQSSLAEALSMTLRSEEELREAESYASDVKALLEKVLYESEHR
jgi:hypothetical protein